MGRPRGQARLPHGRYANSHISGTSRVGTIQLRLLTLWRVSPSVLSRRLTPIRRRLKWGQIWFTRSRKRLRVLPRKTLTWLWSRRNNRDCVIPKLVLMIPGWVTSFRVTRIVPFQMRRRPTDFPPTKLRLAVVIIRQLKLLLFLVINRIRGRRLKVPKLSNNRVGPSIPVVNPARVILPFILRLLTVL